MNQISFFLLYSLVLFTSCGSAGKSSQADLIQPGHWQRNQLRIDGDDLDWLKPLPFTNARENLNYSISNDEGHLYILATSSNESTIQRIIQGGLTVYLNSHGVAIENGAAGISFPTGNMHKKPDNLLSDRPGYRNNKQLALDAVQDYSLFGFQTIHTPENFDYGIENREAIELGIGFNATGDLIYEAKVPLVAFLTRNEILNSYRHSLAIGFVLEPLPPQQGNGSGGTGLSIGGGFGMGTFGGGSGIGISIGSGSLGRIGGGRNRKQVKIWKEILLAKKETAVK